MNTPQTDTHFIKKFCTKHGACKEGYLWATEHCTSMQDVWEKAKPEWLIWVATRKGVLTDNELRRFAVWSARQVQHLMTDPRSIAALDVAERHTEGSATDEELAAAYAAACAAVCDAACDAACDATCAAAWEAARAAACDAAWEAAWEAARAAAWEAAWEAARAAACDAACDAAWEAACEAACDADCAAAWEAAYDAQAEWLRKHTTPNFN
jgi:hypothetical protein